MGTNNLIQSIAHPTDFSETSAGAFSHALRMALATKSRLYLLHVRERGSRDAWTSFPHVRELLARWGLMGLHEPPSNIEAKLGIKVMKVEIQHHNPTSGLFEFILSHRPDLIVLATHGREGLYRWLSGSVSEEIARRTHIPTLFIGPKSQGFVDPVTGQMRLERVLVPVAHDPSPVRSLSILASLLEPLGIFSAAIHFLHIGDQPPEIEAASGDNRQGGVNVMEGPVVETIVRVAQECHANMIAMPTAGHKGFLDTLRGSTTEQVLRQAPCPLLAIRTA
jgi:nucleotide-binding universal stress UspA family protein